MTLQFWNLSPGSLLHIWILLFRKFTHLLPLGEWFLTVKSAKKCAVHPREGEKDVTMSTGMENDDIYSNEKTKHNKNPEIARNDEYMTVVFHALLTPTFNISFQQGDKVVLRGDPPFSWNPSKQVEIQGVRYSSFSTVILFIFFFTQSS